jgi:GNAT superfamily N-acetyltransferase
MTATTLDIRPLTPERLPDLASLFEQGGDPKWCWCAYFRIRGFDFSRAVRSAIARRWRPRHTRPLRKTVPRASSRTTATRPVGWISIGPREDYERLAHSTVLKPLDDKPVWSIVCFVVGRQARGRGVARKLLEAGVDYAREHGARLLEAYPVEVAEGQRVPPGDVYRGTLSMFERAGFKVVARRQWNSTTPVRPIVRRALRPAAPGIGVSDRPSR